MNPVEIIRIKRDGGELSSTDLRAFFSGVSNKKVADYQTSAMLMAMFLQGLSDQEAATLTAVMRDSGEVLKFPGIDPQLLVDKHSTGGVGDKTSLILLPLCCLEGAYVPMISGRGLGHTGGTLDKLESITGFNAHPDSAHATNILKKHGGVFMGQTESLAPLDKELYALRDVTATVENIGLITASILSKKSAEGIASLVMDVKFGSGAFMQKFDDATDLARSILKVGKQCGLNTICFLTDMNSPLGKTAGNALEVIECVDVLKGAGPHDTRELSLGLAARMVRCCFPEKTEEEVRSSLEGHLQSGRAFEKFCQIAADQGGDTTLLENPERFHRAKTKIPIPVPSSGYVQSINVRQLGMAVVELGGGRHLKTDTIDPSVGLSELLKVGDKVEKGQPLAMVETNQTPCQEVIEAVQSAYKVSPSPVKSNSVIREVLS